ncbi:hypothetical protein WJX73_005375 [Symbiochloris irregularis]|uniref:Uncharacterized protein n=1 Tax=Symbiochloris irregularis TaxID=706552 RepID=A0AAW1NTQ9_9CHLO
MEATREGLAAAAAAREAAKRKREAEAAAAAPPAKKRALPTASKAIRHEVQLPKDYDAAAIQHDEALHGDMNQPKWTGTMAKQYPFTLDPFQTTAIACLERNESVLVAAHTSAGKTAVAEYAVAMAFRDKQRIIYTSPLKALSNQKYRELAEEFTDVGLMTGDVSINDNAACIVMTTEILRSMLYRGSELLREVAWVVFDEVHYMQDRERGVVWEETIIFLPRAVRMVFLSATLSNAAEFAGWVAQVHNQPCHVVYTDFRPTPLQHYAFPLGGNGLRLIMDEAGRFKDENFKAMRASTEAAAAAAEAAEASSPSMANGTSSPRGRGGRGRGRGGRGDSWGRGRGGGRGGPEDNGKGQDVASDLFKIIKLIKERSYDPVIVFSFSRRETEMYARIIVEGQQKRGTEKADTGDTKSKAESGGLCFNNEEEQAMVEDVFHNALSGLSEADRNLDAIQAMLPLLKAGVAMHHSGLLPLLKEVVEILFQEHLIKCLFATETFAMGVNMPAKTVVFTTMKKFDGESHRYMGSGEYIQMSGRAGRRGKDDRGLCIMMVDDSMDASTCKEIVTGKPSPLNSSFKLSYYTLLNLMRRVEDAGHDQEYVIARSFNQFQFEQSLPQRQKELKALEDEAAGIQIASDEDMTSYVQLRKDLEKQRSIILDSMLQPQYCTAFLQPGRLIAVKAGAVDWGTGVVVAMSRRSPTRGVPPTAQTAASAYIVDALLECQPGLPPGSQPQPVGKGGSEGELQVVPVALPLLSGISALRISMVQDLRPPEARRATLLSLKAALKRYPDGLPMLDPIEDMSITDVALHGTVRVTEDLEKRLADHAVTQAERQEGDAGKLVQRKAELLNQAAEMRHAMGQSQLQSFRTESKNRAAVLRKLGHITDDMVVTLKGRAACEIDTADELLSSELLLNGVFSSLDTHQLSALASTLIPTESTRDDVHLTKDLADPLAQLQEAARRIARVQAESRLEIDADEYASSFKPSLMDVVYAWSKGADFKEVCKKTSAFEGGIIRSCRRLDELLNQLSNAAHVIGDEELADKFRASDASMRRDIMFAASLYI